MKRKILAAVAAMACMAVLLTGCGNSSGSETTAAAATEAAAVADGEWSWDQRIELMVPAKEGGGLDSVMRKFVPYLEEEIGQTITIINQPGSGGVVGFTWSHNSSRDGYSFQASAPSSILGDVQGMYSGFTLRDELIPVSGLTMSEAFIFSKKDAAWTNAEEFIDYVKNHPGEVSLSLGSVNGIEGAIVKEFEKNAGLEFKWIPSDASEVYISVISGDVDCCIASWADSGAYVESGDINATLVLSQERNSCFPDIVATGELGIESTLGYTRFFTALEGTPQAAVDSFEAAVARAAKNPEWEEWLAGNGMVNDYVYTSEELQAVIDNLYEIGETLQ